jgi:hypothetical protein
MAVAPTITPFFAPLPNAIDTRKRKSSMCDGCAAKVARGEMAVCGCVRPDRDGVWC